MNKMKFASTIKHIAITDEDDRVLTELLIDSADETIFSRLMGLMEKVTALQDGTAEKLEPYKLGDGEAASLEDMKAVVTITNDCIRDIMAATEEMFGKGLFKGIFADNYALNPDFIPNIEMIASFYEQIIPIVKGVFSEKTRTYTPVKNRKK